ncbi:putative nuclease HARBI1 [Plectropomus leopardus]|uniref:putative nuclease HARBI1 n=1 Tax=Plectropomus leopardus TaxID=160734 RepID=UPI001C4B4EFD|nr:putative nuclease HARBI1 [Plectropomus leopardus]
MAFALPVWLAVQEELLAEQDGADSATQSCFDDFDDAALYTMFHLTRPCIAFITDAVTVRMKSTAVKKPPLPREVSASSLIMVALHYYAHGVLHADIAQRVSHSQADCFTVISVISGVIAGMADAFISFPQIREARANVAFKTEKLCGIPNVLGVVAPAHFKIRASPYDKDSFRSYVNTLGYTSVVSQVMCDSDGNILSVEKCCVGSTVEQEMWETSFKGREMEEHLHGNTWIIAGKGYKLSKHVLTPVSEPADYKDIRFNDAHAKIHNVMRTTLDLVRRRFRCLMQLGFAQEGSLDKKANIIKACCVLHNIAKKFSVPPPPAAGRIEPLHPGKQRSMPVESNPEALKARQELINKIFSVVSGSQEPRSKGITEEEDV